MIKAIKRNFENGSNIHGTLLRDVRDAEMTRNNPSVQ